MRYHCESETRRRVLRDSTIALNGIDYLEVVDLEAPEGSDRQRLLLVRMLKPDPWGLIADNAPAE